MFVSEVKRWSLHLNQDHTTLGLPLLVQASTSPTPQPSNSRLTTSQNDVTLLGGGKRSICTDMIIFSSF